MKHLCFISSLDNLWSDFKNWQIISYPRSTNHILQTHISCISLLTSKQSWWLCYYYYKFFQFFSSFFNNAHTHTHSKTNMIRLMPYSYFIYLVYMCVVFSLLVFCCSIKIKGIQFHRSQDTTKYSLLIHLHNKECDLLFETVTHLSLRSATFRFLVLKYCSCVSSMLLCFMLKLK